MNRGFRGLALTLVGALCLVAVIAPAAAKGKSAFVGNWQFDAAKSTFTGRPGYASAKLAVTAIKGGYKVVADLVGADGKAIHSEYIGPYDGSSLAVSGSPMFDSVSVLEPDRNSVVRTERRGGTVVGTTMATVEKNGKSFTSNGRGTMPDGHQYTYTSVWNRVK